jgi:uncharacterized membrane protein
MNELTQNVLIAMVHAPVSATNTLDNNSTILDMAGWDGVVFIQPITDSATGGIATLVAQGSTTNADTYMATLTGASAAATSLTPGDDLNGLLLIVDVYKPLKRYIQGTITISAANIAYGNMIAIQYHGKLAPITDDATVAKRACVVGV